MSTATLIICTALLVALCIDQVLGEPATQWHPVGWMGRYLDWAAKKFAPISVDQSHKTQDFLAGTVYWSFGALVVYAAFWWLELWLLQLPAAWAALAMGIALKPLLALAMLCAEVLAVEAALSESLEAGRSRLTWLVSRDTSQLTHTQVRESAIESLAENFNDSVVAPIFWFVLLGLPGAALYRFANTADAMWGYPEQRAGRYWQWAGKWAARADDVLSWIPARLTAGLILLLAPRAWSHIGDVVKDSNLTPSPNSGWPMAAMACVLRVQLGKPAVYVLNAKALPPQLSDTHAAVSTVRKTLLPLLLMAFMAIYFLAK